MIRILVSLLSVLFPMLAFADGLGTNSLTFTPPPSDYSIVFLGNIFGIVDGVLHGSGSQIMGSMFAVFNSAVLALGGIVIMYTLLVSTLNTAHEGQMLGQKWSSIWVPVRSTLGLALLIPKASGYCLMQIFVMWIVVQGVGAADKVWDAALNYLNRGGVIVQQQIKPTLSWKSDNFSVAMGATAMLSGQVCMYGLQQVLTNIRAGYLSAMQQNSGACSGSPGEAMQQFCNTSVPDFLSTFNATAAQQAQSDAESYTITLPNFDSGSPYAFLNGICGSITWDRFSEKNMEKINQNIQGISEDEKEFTKMSRSIAVQFMYQELSTLAQTMVNNDPQINNELLRQIENDPTQQFSAVAFEQYGIPYLSSGSPCTGKDNDCILWGKAKVGKGAPILNGAQFLGAITDYNGIMNPSLNLVVQAENGKKASKIREFIQYASAEGWLMAGSYYFNLVSLNDISDSTENETDKNAGLDKSDATIQLDSAFSGSTPGSACVGNYATLCEWVPDQSSVNIIVGLIDGSTILESPKPLPDWKSISGGKTYDGLASSTVYGFINNSAFLRLPNEQKMVSPPNFISAIKPHLSLTQLAVPKQKFACGKVRIMFFSFCLGEMMGDLFYNDIFRFLYNLFLGIVSGLIDAVIRMFLVTPLEGMSMIFIASIQPLEQPNTNPILALSQMGVNYINYSNELWIYLVEVAVLSALFPWFGIFVMPLITLTLPLLLAWLATMLSIGFVTAYYVPFLPFMLFTFGIIGWLMAVIEAMVAAPIVALGITHPEGEGPFGKGEQAIMILMNVFLRPAMMIIGYISGIALSYVGIWVMNAGFTNAATFILGPLETKSGLQSKTGGSVGDITKAAKNLGHGGGYDDWAGIYALFFSILIYTSLYVTIVQKSFTLITMLPDKVLRWIGGQAETIGSETSGWADDTKKQVGDAGDKTAKASKEMGKSMGDMAQEGLSSSSEESPSISTKPGE